MNAVQQRLKVIREAMQYFKIMRELQPESAEQYHYFNAIASVAGWHPAQGRDGMVRLIFDGIRHRVQYSNWADAVLDGFGIDYDDMEPRMAIVGGSIAGQGCHTTPSEDDLHLLIAHASDIAGENDTVRNAILCADDSIRNPWEIIVNDCSVVLPYLLLWKAFLSDGMDIMNTSASCTMAKALAMVKALQVFTRGLPAFTPVKTIRYDNERQALV